MDPTGNEHLSNAPSTAGINPADRRRAGKKRRGAHLDAAQGEGNDIAARPFDEGPALTRAWPDPHREHTDK